MLNGIAYDTSENRLYITGKLYSYVYELNLAGIKFHLD
ncbi:MAG: glutaminyl-peptide cyclotransferase [Gammaproteobacteria bacterium]